MSVLTTNIATTSVVFKNFAHIAQRTAATRDNVAVSANLAEPTLRLALLYREQLCFPNSSAWLLQILSGKAWVSFDGQDFELQSGDRLPVPRLKNDAIISAIGGEALLFEITQK